MPTLCLTPVQSPLGGGVGPKVPVNVITFWNDIPYEAAKGLLPQYTTPPTAHIKDGILVAKFPRFDRGWIGDTVCFGDVCVPVDDFIDVTKLDVGPVPDHPEDDFTRVGSTPVPATVMVFTKQPDTDTEPSLRGIDHYAFPSGFPAKRFRKVVLTGSFGHSLYWNSSDCQVSGTHVADYLDSFSGEAETPATGPDIIVGNTRFQRVISNKNPGDIDGNTADDILGFVSLSDKDSGLTTLQTLSSFQSFTTPNHTPAYGLVLPASSSTIQVKTFDRSVASCVAAGFIFTTPMSMLHTAGLATQTLSVEDTEADAIARIPVIDWTVLPWNERDLLTTLDTDGWFRSWAGYSVYFEREAGSTNTSFVYAPTKWKVDVSNLLPAKTYLARVKFSKRVVKGLFTHNEANMPFNTIGAWEDHSELIVPFTTDVSGVASFEGDTDILFGHEIRIDEPEFLTAL